MATTEGQIKKIISECGGKATKQQIVRESKLSSGYIDFLCQSLCRKREITFSDGFYTLKTSIPAKISGNEPQLSVTKPEVILKSKKDKIKTAKVPKSKKHFRQTQKLSRQKISKPKKSTKSSALGKKPGYKTIQFQAKFPFLKLVFIPYKRKRVTTS